MSVTRQRPLEEEDTIKSEELAKSDADESVVIISEWKKNVPLKIILVVSPSDVKKKGGMYCWLKLSLFVVYFTSVNTRRSQREQAWNVTYGTRNEKKQWMHFVN